METTTINNFGDKYFLKTEDIPENTAYINEADLDSPETLEAIESAIKSNFIPRLNREQRRFLAKKAGKRGRANAETISETAKKLTYIKLIEGLRKLNEEKEKENG